MWFEYVVFAIVLYYLLGALLVPCRIEQRFFVKAIVYCLFISFWLPLLLVKIVDHWFLQGRIRQWMLKVQKQRLKDRDENET